MIEHTCATCMDWQTPCEAHPCNLCLPDPDGRIFWTPSTLALRCQNAERRAEVAEAALEWLRLRGVGVGKHGKGYIAGLDTDEGHMAGRETPAVQERETFLRLLREAIADA